MEWPIPIPGVEYYYVDDYAAIIHGDSLEILPNIPDDTFDLCLTDPPYGIGYNNGTDLGSVYSQIFDSVRKKSAPKAITNDDSLSIAIEVLQKAALATHPKMKNGAAFCCFSAGGGGTPVTPKFTIALAEIFTLKDTIIWEKARQGLGVHIRRSYETIIVLQKGAPCHRWNGGHKTSDVWHYPGMYSKPSGHPAEKPVPVLSKFIQVYSDAGDIVIDPFMGSGTTLEAAKSLNRRCIGIELSEEYCEMAVQRLQQEVFNFA